MADNGTVLFYTHEKDNKDSDTNKNATGKMYRYPRYPRQVTKFELIT
jgi:hypothetical protein